MIRKITEKDILRGRLVIRMLLSHRSDATYENYRGAKYPDYHQQILDSLTKLGIQHNMSQKKLGDEMIYNYFIYIKQPKDELCDWEKEVFNDDFLIEFMVHAASRWSYINPGIEFERLDAGKLDLDIHNAMGSIIEEISERHFIFRYYQYPKIPIMINKVRNYRVWNIVEKIKGMWL